MFLETIDGDFAVCKVCDYSLVNLNAPFVFIGKTDNENSLVCPVDSVPSNAVVVEKTWRAFRISGTLDFSLIGVLSKLSGALADNKIGIFAVSTFDTDYILVKKENYENALKVLDEKGYKIIEI